MDIDFPFAVPAVDGRTSPVAPDVGVSIEELYSDIAVNKVETTSPVSSFGTKHGSLELPLVLGVMVSDALLLLQQSLLFSLFVEVIWLIDRTYGVSILNPW